MISRFVKYFLSGIILIIFFFPLSIEGSNNIIDDSFNEEVDSTYFELREIPQEKINEYLANNDFDYHPNKTHFKKSVWQLIREFIIDKLGLRDLNLDLPYLKYIFMFIILGLLIYLLLKNEINGIFKKVRPMENTDLQITELHKITDQDFDKIINEAIVSANYKDALRFLYIKLLSILNKKEYIKWEIDKTNTDYKNEIKDKSLENGFILLSSIYEYVWYGDQEVNQELFPSFHSKFLNFFNQINEEGSKK